MLSRLRPEQKLSSQNEQLKVNERMTLSDEAEVSANLLYRCVDG